MGKGDRRTKRGKIYAGTSGKFRKAQKGGIVAGIAAAKAAAKAKPKAPKPAPVAAAAE